MRSTFASYCARLASTGFNSNRWRLVSHASLARIALAPLPRLPCPASFPRPADRKTATPADVVMMSDTRVNSAQLMHPQERNVHNKVRLRLPLSLLGRRADRNLRFLRQVFGGYLMRLAYETAYSTACLFSRSAVTFVALECVRTVQLSLRLTD